MKNLILSTFEISIWLIMATASSLVPINKVSVHADIRIQTRNYPKQTHLVYDYASLFIHVVSEDAYFVFTSTSEDAVAMVN